MVLSDRTIRRLIAEGRIGIEPFDPSLMQPSSLDVRVDRYFRVFRNHTMGYIDVKEDQEELTELVEIKPDDVFILHPGEFVLGSTLERVALPDDLANDRHRDYELMVAGYLVLRITNDQIETDLQRAMDKIRAVIRFRQSMGKHTLTL